MLQVKSLILYFLLLLLGIPLDLGLDASDEQIGCFEALVEKNLEFAPNRGDSIITFNLSLVLLPAEVDFVLEEQGHKRNALVARGSGCVKMVLALSTKVVALYMRALIV